MQVKSKGSTKILMTNGSLMQVESIVEYFWPALSDKWSFWEWPFYTGFTVGGSPARVS